jgi:glutaconate CoA-transferase subunit A
MSTGQAGPIVTDLPTALAQEVHDGDTVFIGGFGHAIPFAAAHELIRQRRRALTVCRSGADILVDQLIAAGCVRRLIVGWIGNPGIGLAHAFSRAVAAGSIELEEWTNYTMLLRLQAAATGVPFLPARVLRDGDIPGASIDVRTVTCPYSGEVLSAIPALRPHVALIHAQRASTSGNIQLWGILGDTVLGALAADRIVVTVEELVSDAECSSAPDRTVIPSYRVSAVCVVPGGARPSWVEGHYGRDDEAYGAYDSIARDPQRLNGFIEELSVGGTR